MKMEERKKSKRMGHKTKKNQHKTNEKTIVEKHYFYIPTQPIQPSTLLSKVTGVP